MYYIVVHSLLVLQDFLELAGRWATLQSNAVVKLYGVTLSSPFAMVTEYLSLGPLDVYLKEHKLSLKQVDLVEAGAFLARALWHLVCGVGDKHSLNYCVM
jgi:Janus kinase 2/BCL2-associated athanogene 2